MTKGYAYMFVLGAIGAVFLQDSAKAQSTGMIPNNTVGPPMDIRPTRSSSLGRSNAPPADLDTLTPDHASATKRRMPLGSTNPVKQRQQPDEKRNVNQDTGDTTNRPANGTSRPILRPASTANISDRSRTDGSRHFEPSKALAQRLDPQPRLVLSEPPNAATAASENDLATSFCKNLGEHASEALFAWQANRLSQMNEDISKAMVELRKRKDELEALELKQKSNADAATTAYTGIISKMRPEAAASHLSAMDEELAAQILSKIDQRIASTILNEIPPQKAAKFARSLAQR